MSGKPTPNEVLAVLHAIERGEITVTFLGIGPPKNTHCGNISYRASNGWTLVVFNDCDEWDYLDSVIMPDGVVTDFWDACEEDPFGTDEYEEVRNYGPPEDIEGSVYGIGRLA